jgi:hypothetical protein
MLARKPPKPKECKVCKTIFTPMLGLLKARVCSLDCAHSLAKSKRAKEQKRAQVIEKREDRVRKEKLKTRSDYIKECQIAFNRYIRIRDRGLPCICCGVPLGADAVGGAFDCGHYRSVGSAPHLRFHEDNAHGQRKQCNRYGGGRAVDYRRGLVERLGVERVERIESDQAPRHYSVDELREMTATYRRKANELEKKQ